MLTRIKVFHVKAALFIFFIVYSSQSYACRCAGDLTPKQAYEKADIVLIGTATTISGDPFKKGGSSINIDVARAWKCHSPRVIKIFSSTSCAFNFSVGEQYLLYLNKVKGEDYYATDVCRGNVPVSEADDKLHWLKNNAESEFVFEKSVVR
jgi:hypothetical protein